MLIPIEQAAEILKKKPGTLRRWCREGMPHAPGRRGRGHPTLVDVEQARQWIGAPADDRAVLTLADELPKLMAREILKYWRELERPDKAKLAAAFSAAWQICAVAAVEHMQRQNPGIPRLEEFPDEIRYLEKIARRL